MTLLSVVLKCVPSIFISIVSTNSSFRGQMKITPDVFGHLTHYLKGLANGRVMVLLEVGIAPITSSFLSSRSREVIVSIRWRRVLHGRCVRCSEILVHLYKHVRTPIRCKYRRSNPSEGTTLKILSVWNKRLPVRNTFWKNFGNRYASMWPTEAKLGSKTHWRNGSTFLGFLITEYLHHLYMQGRCSVG